MTTTDEIIEMANQVELCQCIWIDDEGPEIASLVAFAKLVAGKIRKETLEEMIFAHPTTAIKLSVEKEREACAKVCEEIYTGEEACGDWPTPEMCASAIRARGEA
jgi:hypothetical protein